MSLNIAQMQDKMCSQKSLSEEKNLLILNALKGPTIRSFFSLLWIK